MELGIEASELSGGRGILSGNRGGWGGGGAIPTINLSGRNLGRTLNGGKHLY